MEHKGTKRFRHLDHRYDQGHKDKLLKSSTLAAGRTQCDNLAKNRNDRLDARNFDFENFDTKEALNFFRKLSLKTSYCDVFGAKPKSTDEAMVLKRKNFRDLEISQHFQDLAIEYIEKWIQYNDDEDFICRLYFTIRDIATVIRNQDYTHTTQSDTFLGKRTDKPPRFDRIIANVRKEGRSKSINEFNRNRHHRQPMPAANIEEFLLANEAAYGRPKVNLKQYADNALRGQTFDITAYWAEGVKEPKTTSYMATLKGL